MPAATVNDIQLAYVEQGRGQPVVFVHGGLGDYRHFAGQMAAFAERHRAIAVSCRGYWPNEPLRRRWTPLPSTSSATPPRAVSGACASRSATRDCCGRWCCSSRPHSRCSESTSRPLRRS